MATKQQIRAFERIQKRFVSQSLKLDRRAIAELRRELEQVRKAIADAILGSQGFDLFYYQQLKRAVDRVWMDFAVRYDSLLDKRAIDGFELGKELMEQPLTAAGMGIKVSALPEINLDVLEAQLLRNTQFITALSQDAANKINNNILTGITSQKTAFEVMKDIGRNLRDKSTFKTIFHRAEAIARTEISAALNTATAKRMDAAGKVVPGMKKYWIWSHKVSGRPEHQQVEQETNPKFGGTPIPVDEDFKVSLPNGKVEKAAGPHQAGLSAANVIACGCRTGFILPEEDLN